MSVTLLESPTARAKPSHSPLRLIQAEIMKIRTTNVWWMFALAMVLVTALAFTVNAFSHHFNDFHPPPLDQVPKEERDQIAAQAAAARTAAGVAKIAADLMTSGQFFGLLFALLIGILVVTNEFFHQTATTTFMTVPHRTAVIFAKAVAATLFGGVFWLVATVLDLIATPIYLNSEHVSVHLADWTVVRSVLLNLLAFAVWAIFGLGLGTLIRSQIGSVVAGICLYLLGFAAVLIIFNLIYRAYPHAWIHTAEVIAPAVASSVMITPGRLYPDAPPQWVGAAVLIGYAVVTGFIGILITRKRDIS
jgi:ABC-type transport system involved in multi-copper enzyme maturation permease subunit